VSGVGVLASDMDVDLTDPIPLSFHDAIDQIELTWLFQETGVGLNISKDKSTAAINVANLAKVGIHLRLVEELATGQLQFPLKELFLETTVAHKGDIANLVARAFVDDKGKQRPVTADAIEHLNLTANAGLEEAEAAVVGGQGFNVMVDLLVINIAAEKPEDTRL
jgi:hypothetical protein